MKLAGKIDGKTRVILQRLISGNYELVRLPGKSTEELRRFINEEKLKKKVIYCYGDIILIRRNKNGSMDGHKR